MLGAAPGPGNKELKEEDRIPTHVELTFQWEFHVIRERRGWEGIRLTPHFRNEEIDSVRSDLSRGHIYI